MTINTNSVSAIKNCIGKSVFNITRIQSFINDKENEHEFGDLEIIFEDNSYLTLTGIGGGESIKAENKEANIPIAFDISDSKIISWRYLDMKLSYGWKEIIGQTLQSIELFWGMNQFSEGTLTGCILNFDKDFVSFYRVCSDVNRCFINERLFSENDQIRIERINLNF